MKVFAMQILPGSDKKSLFQKLICLSILSMILSWFKTFMSDAVLIWKPRIVACVTGVYPISFIIYLDKAGQFKVRMEVFS